MFFYIRSIAHMRLIQRQVRCFFFLCFIRRYTFETICRVRRCLILLLDFCLHVRRVVLIMMSNNENIINNFFCVHVHNVIFFQHYFTSTRRQRRKEAIVSFFFYSVTNEQYVSLLREKTQFLFPHK